MNRTLAAFLAAAAVVGTAGGTLAATSLGADDESPTGSRRTDGPTASDPAVTADPADPTGLPDDRTDQVLWADRSELHDGGTTVSLSLVDPPLSLQRYADGWVITQSIDPAEPAYQTSVVAPDGSVTPLVESFDFGDVSPDGTRYVAQSLDGTGYGVWVIATGERVETMDSGTTSDQGSIGGAQWVDDDTIATTWSGDAAADSVLVSDLGTDTAEVLADDVYGEWAISPDGAWFAGTLLDVEGGASNEGCLVIRPVDGSSDGRTDCGGRPLGMPSFAPDSSAVLTVPAGSDGFGPSSFRPVPTGESRVPAAIEGPEAGLTAVYLADSAIAVLGAKDYSDQDGTRIYTCRADVGCEPIGRSSRPYADAVLGTGY